MRWLRHSLRTTQVSIRRKRDGPPDAVSHVDALIRPLDPERPEREDEARPWHCLKTTGRLLRPHLYHTRSDLNKPLLEARRRGLLAADRGGLLRRSLRAARRASTLARDREEASRAAKLLVMLECDAGPLARQISAELDARGK